MFAIYVFKRGRTEEMLERLSIESSYLWRLCHANADGIGACMRISNVNETGETDGGIHTGSAFSFY